MHLKITGKNSYMRKSAAQRAMIKQGAANFVRQQSVKILKDLVLNTPQWSGNTAASWQIVTPSVEASYEPTELAVRNWKYVKDPSFKGDLRAWKEALANAQPALKSIRYNSTIEFRNTAPYSDALATFPEEQLNLRAGNFIRGDVMAVYLATSKYKLSSNVVGLRLLQDLNYE